MNTSSNCLASTGTILASDLGKYKSVACFYPGDPGRAKFTSLPSDREHLRKLFAKGNRCLFN